MGRPENPTPLIVNSGESNLKKRFTKTTTPNGFT